MLLIAITACVPAVALPFLAAKVWLKIRDGEYSKFSQIAASWLPPRGQRPSPSSQQIVRLNALSSLLQDHHEAAVNLQKKYHFILSMGIAALFVGFIGLGCSLTVAAGSDSMVEFLAVLDAACFLITAVCFHLGRKINRKWIGKRAETELMRQWQMVDELLLGPSGKQDLTTRFQAFAARVQAMAGGVAGVQSIGEFWSDRRGEITQAGAARGMRPEAVQAYLARRVWRQADWFHASRARLVHHSHFRETWLKRLFFVVLVLSILKVPLAMHMLPEALSTYKPALSLIIMTMVGLSAGWSALYLSQNTRSLQHRYLMQERSIQAWLENFGQLYPRQPGAMSDQPWSVEVTAQVLEFERLMMDELVDWIHITSHDAIELAP